MYSFFSYPAFSKVCTDEKTRLCGLNTGICSQGIQKCSKGSWTTCQGNIVAGEIEICMDGQDSLCNGDQDETTNCITLP